MQRGSAVWKRTSKESARGSERNAVARRSLYAMGILGEHERKSVEPLAAAAADDPEGAQRTHDHLLHFIGQSEWEDGPIREFAARHAVHAMESRERISAWVIDDTGFMKQGRESPGVQRQYTGSVGKVSVSANLEGEWIENAEGRGSGRGDRERSASARISSTVRWR